MHNKIISFSIVLLTLSNLANAGVSELLYKENYGACSITAWHDAVPGEKGVIVFKPDNNTAVCKLSKTQVTNILKNAFEKYQFRKDLSEITSIYLSGRLISYPWLNDYLTNSSKNNSRWNQTIGKPTESSINEYANSLLYSQRLLEPFLLALQQYQYDVTGISCEKVLINKENLPYDAMCWVIIKSAQQ